MLVKLNTELSQGKLSQSEFINKLQKLTVRFQEQKQSIDKARFDIEKGYKAALGLMKQAYKDAKKLGAKINFSRSQGNMKLKEARMLQNIIVDEFTCITPKNQNTLNAATAQQGIQSEESYKSKNEFISSSLLNHKSG